LLQVEARQFACPELTCFVPLLSDLQPSVSAAMNSSAQLSAKRKRSDTVAETQVIKRSDLWYEDGNIVLQAESTQFRVYRGILRDSSSIFDDMLNIPQPAEDQGTLVDGCPVVQLSDSAEDWEHVLKALYKRR